MFIVYKLYIIKYNIAKNIQTAKQNSGSWDKVSTCYFHHSTQARNVKYVTAQYIHKCIHIHIIYNVYYTYTYVHIYIYIHIYNSYKTRFRTKMKNTGMQI